MEKQNRFKNQMQIDDDHCGPAVIQMLLENLGIQVTQEDITRAAGAEKTIHEHGTRIDQLARAVSTLAPSTKLWYKEHGTLEELIRVIMEFDHPVGVEWQGIFGDKDEPENEDADYGHYSIIFHIDMEKHVVIIADPYKDFVNQNRVVDLDVFLGRWWDTNEVLDPKTGKYTVKDDDELFFVVTRINDDFPTKLGMKTFENLSPAY